MKFYSPQFIAFLKANSSILIKHFGLDTQDNTALDTFIARCKERLQLHDNSARGEFNSMKVDKISRQTSSLVRPDFPFSSFRLGDQIYLLASDPKKPLKNPPTLTHADQRGRNQENPPLPKHYVGKGSFGVVKLVIPLKINNESAYELYVAKITRPKEDSSLSNEVNFLKEMEQLIHTGTRKYQTSENEGINYKSYTIMPYFSGGDLSSKLSRHQNKEEIITATEWVRILLQAALYIRRLHRKNIIHRDIKPANMVLNQHNEVVLVDFGLAEHADRCTNNLKGSPKYMPLILNPNGTENKQKSIRLFENHPFFNAKNRDLYAFFIIFRRVYLLLGEDEQKRLQSYLPRLLFCRFLQNPLVYEHEVMVLYRMEYINQLSTLDELIARLILFDKNISITKSKRDDAFPPGLVSSIINHYLTPGESSWLAVVRLIFQEQCVIQEWIEVAASNCPNDLFSFLMKSHVLSDDFWLALLQNNLLLFIQHYIGYPRLDYRKLPRSQGWLRDNQVFPRWISKDLIEQDNCTVLPRLFLNSPELLTLLPPDCESFINNDEYMIKLVIRAHGIIPSIPDAMMRPSLFLYILTDKNLGRIYHENMYERLLRFPAEKQCFIVVHMLSHFKKAIGYDWENAQQFLWKSLCALPQATFDFPSFRDLVVPTNSLRSRLESLVTMMPSGTANKDFLQALLDSANTKSAQEAAAPPPPPPPPPVHHPSPLQISPANQDGEVICDSASTRICST